ncbi:Gfo/Idh/MocA family oxidoreductase [Clostridium sp. D53t1_180928_C8]|uniref:Gfo/Idh/MocA family protein n=1 Tax=Clostridium sp. D53t1_180928_C8 TaxID=2787101 RepID=UPI0018A8F4FE|nr:Gfo/Idh/MocA family oxidoreductase [Clostridium sp. D53t1_180928_C8]
MKLGIIGSGMIVKEFLTITHHIDGLVLEAIYGRVNKKEKLNKIKNTYGIKKVFYDYDELLNSDIDTVYIALPNNLHFKFAKQALEANKNVIVEKPITTNYKETLILSDLAKERKLFIFEAITNQYLPNYKKIKELVPKLGDIKIVQCNFSQYSSRYNSFKEGNILPVFDPNFAGGALMDLNIYNIHYVVGLFGKPKNVEYYPNIERGIDTSGILILEYNSFKCVCIGAKDCKAPISNNIQGDKGCIYQDNPTNSCESFKVLMNDGTHNLINENIYDNRIVNEFIEFIEIIKNNNLERCYEMLEHSLIVAEIQTIARMKSGIIFDADNEIV